MLHEHKFQPESVPAEVVAIVERCISSGEYQKLLRVTRELTDPDLVGAQRGLALQEQTTLQCRIRGYAQDAGLENREFDQLCRAEIRARARRAGRAEAGTKHEARTYRDRVAAVSIAERAVSGARRKLELEEQRLAEAQQQLREYNQMGRAGQ